MNTSEPTSSRELSNVGLKCYSIRKRRMGVLESVGNRKSRPMQQERSERDFSLTAIKRVNFA